MANNIKDAPKTPLWPWGPPAQVAERLVDPEQLDRKRLTKKGNPKRPPLPSVALLDFIGYAHSSDELRLPAPPLPPGHEADLHGFQDRSHLSTIVRRGDEANLQALEEGIEGLQAPPDRKKRMLSLLERSRQMVGVVEQVRDWVRQADQERRRGAQGEEA